MEESPKIFSKESLLLKNAIWVVQSYDTGDVCKWDMNELTLDENKLGELVTDRSKWRSYLQATLKFGEKYIITTLENKRRLKKEKLKTTNLVVANNVTNKSLTTL